MSGKNNVIDFQSRRRSVGKSRSDGEAETPSGGNSAKLSQRLRDSIDDGLKQQMREQMRKKHGLEQQ
ncbi:hypothetical protein AB4258_23535 [Vibrio splendidus]